MGFWVAERPILCGGVARPVRNWPGLRAVFAGDEGVEAFEREGEVGAALVVGYGVDLVDDDGADAAEMFAGFAGGEEDVEGFGGGDEDVRRVAEHGGTLFGERVAGADGGADLGAEVAAFAVASCWISARGPSRFFWTSLERALSGLT